MLEGARAFTAGRRPPGARAAATPPPPRPVPSPGRPRPRRSASPERPRHASPRAAAAGSDTQTGRRNPERRWWQRRWWWERKGMMLTGSMEKSSRCGWPTRQSLVLMYIRAREEVLKLPECSSSSCLDAAAACCTSTLHNRASRGAHVMTRSPARQASATVGAAPSTCSSHRASSLGVDGRPK